MATIQDQFRARMERDVARFMRHASLEGLNPGELDGQIILTVRDGQLADVALPGDQAVETSLLDAAWTPGEDVLREPLQPIKPRKPKGNA